MRASIPFTRVLVYDLKGQNPLYLFNGNAARLRHQEEDEHKGNELPDPKEDESASIASKLLSVDETKRRRTLLSQTRDYALRMIELTAHVPILGMASSEFREP